MEDGDRGVEPLDQAAVAVLGGGRPAHRLGRGDENADGAVAEIETGAGARQKPPQGRPEAAQALQMRFAAVMQPAGEPRNLKPVRVGGADLEIGRGGAIGAAEHRRAGGIGPHEARAVGGPKPSRQGADRMRGEPWITEPAQQELDIAHPRNLSAAPRIAAPGATTHSLPRERMKADARAPP